MSDDYLNGASDEIGNWPGVRDSAPSAPTLRVETRFKNARLHNAIAARSVCLHDGVRMASLHAVGPIKAFCDVHGLNLSLVYDLLNLRKGPLIRRGSRGNVYALRPICARLASLLERDADWLFPASLYNITWPTKLVAEVAHEQAISLIAAPHEMLMLPATQESDQIRRELRDGLRGVLATLTPRQQQVIRLRFGLDDGVERTYAAIGAALALTHESIRQIETKALYKLRGPRRTRQLRPWYEE